MTTVKNLQFWLISFLKGNVYNFKAVDNPKDLTPIFKYSDLHSDLWKWKCYPWFFQTVSHTLFFFPPFFWQKIIYWQMSLKCYPNSVLLFFFQYRQNRRFGSTVITYVRAYACEISFWEPAGGAYAASAHPGLINLTLRLPLSW